MRSRASFLVHFTHDSLPFQKFMDKMTNACFQDHASTRLPGRTEDPLQKWIDDKPLKKKLNWQILKMIEDL